MEMVEYESVKLGSLACFARDVVSVLKNKYLAVFIIIKKIIGKRQFET